MQAFKELVIKRPRVGSLPTLDLQGKWLEDLNFTTGTTVNVSYQDSCLTLSTNTTAVASSVLQVTSKLVRNRPRTHLTLNGFLLLKYGFNVGDHVGLSLMPNMIQITKVIHFTTVKVA